MSSRNDVETVITESRLIAIIRLPETKHVAEVARAIAGGGFRAIEITLNTPGALDAIAHLRSAFDDTVVIGAGTVRNVEQVAAAAARGAQFIVSPDCIPDVIAETHRQGLVSIPGALTPTEVTAAHNAGADFVKLFPADLFGPGYIKTLLAPLDDVRLIPTGGVRTENIPAYLEAGAVGLAVGSSLVNPAWVKDTQWDKLADTARAYTRAVQKFLD